MISRKSIEGFLAQKSFAVVGVSRSGKKFGNSIYRMLKERGRRVFAINHRAQNIDGDRCYRDLAELPESVDAVVISVPPKQTERVVKQAAEAGIQRVWMQQGSESRKAIQYCEQYGLDAVYGCCIFMYAEPVTSIHKVHWWLTRVVGRIPK